MSDRELTILCAAILWGTAPWDNANYLPENAVKDARKVIDAVDKALLGNNETNTNNQGEINA